MSKPIRDRKYLAWIRTQPCAVCGSTRNIEAAHVGPHGLGQKASDRSTIPLCARHHRTGNDSVHSLGPRKFEAVHSLGLAELVRRLNAKPQLKIESGWYVAHLDGHEYTVGRSDIPVAVAIKCARQICCASRLREAS